MGIKGLNNFLRNKCPSSFIEIPKSYFKNKRIAIDANNLLHKLKSRAHKEIVNKTDVAVKEPDDDEICRRWLYHIRCFVIELLQIGATPIFVRDGTHVPQKSATQKKRREDRDKMINAAEDLKIKIRSIDELERTPAMVTELRKKMQNLGTMPRDEVDLALTILQALGIPVLVATGEAEKLCAMLCIEGRVDAVYSRDTDLVALGCPLIINEPGGYLKNANGNVEEGFKCTIFKPILSALNMTYSAFVDLCIMSGCDFNDNIPHLGVGKAYDTLVQCGSIENLPQKFHKQTTCKNPRHGTCLRIAEMFEDQTDCLNYNKCREIFSHGKSEDFCQGDIILDIDTDLSDSRDILEMYSAEDWLSHITPLYKNLIRPHNNIVPKRPSLNSSNARLRIQTPKINPQLNIVNTSNNTSNNTSHNIQIVQNSIVGGDIIHTYGKQKSSPTRISNKQINSLNHIQINNIRRRQQKSAPVRLNILK